MKFSRLKEDYVGDEPTAVIFPGSDSASNILPTTDNPTNILSSPRGPSSPCVEVTRPGAVLVEPTSPLALCTSLRITKLGVLCTIFLVLLVVFVLDTRVSNYNHFIQVSEHLNFSKYSQEAFREELQTAGEKMNLLQRDLEVVRSNNTLARLRDSLQPDLESLKTLLINLIRDNTASVENAVKSIEMANNKMTELGSQLSVQQLLNSQQQKVIQDRIERVINKTEDFSIDTGSKHDNLYSEIEELRHLLENVQDETEENMLQQGLRNEDTNQKINLLEAALNLTILQMADTTTGHKEFANKTMELLRTVMEIYNRQMIAENSTSAADGKLDDVTVEDDATTEQSDAVSFISPDSCTDTEQVPGSMISCSASSTYSRKWTCEKAFDGILQTNKGGSAWASRGEGVGAWIQANFTKIVVVKEIKVLQRFAELEANKQIEIKFDKGVEQNAVLPAKGSRHWNVIKLSRGIPTKTLRITVTEVYGTINNGFKEISIIGCF